MEKKKETEIWELEQYMWLNKHPVRLMFSFKPFPSNWKTFYWETPPHRHTHTLAPTLLWMKVMPSRWPASCPTGCGLSSRSVRLSHTLHSASSLPENSSWDELSANATAFTSSSWASIWWGWQQKKESVFTVWSVCTCVQECAIYKWAIYMLLWKVCVCAHLCMSVPMQK